MFSINISAIKLEDITVTFQPNNPKIPIIEPTEKAHPNNGITTHFIFLKISHSVAMMNKKTPIPKTMMSLLMNVIISSVIIGRPPR